MRASLINVARIVGLGLIVFYGPIACMQETRIDVCTAWNPEVKRVYSEKQNKYVIAYDSQIAALVDHSFCGDVFK